MNRIEFFWRIKKQWPLKNRYMIKKLSKKDIKIIYVSYYVYYI